MSQDLFCVFLHLVNTANVFENFACTTHIEVLFGLYGNIVCYVRLQSKASAMLELHGKEIGDVGDSGQNKRRCEGDTAKIRRCWGYTANKLGLFGLQGKHIADVGFTRQASQLFLGYTANTLAILGLRGIHHKYFGVTWYTSYIQIYIYTDIWRLQITQVSYL